jgi:hypothetical protein
MQNEKMESESLTRAERSPDLIANFVEGFADGWYMALKESFKMELDIRITSINKIWTQGPYYQFSEGQIIYDVKESYMCWHDALKKINLACQIVAAKKNMPLKIINEVTGKPGFRVLEGYVQFVLLRPNEGRTSLVPYVGYHLSQNKFVNFLKTGEL